MVIRRLPRVVLVVPAAALAVASGMLPAVAASPAGWRVQTTIAMRGKDVELLKVAADVPLQSMAHVPRSRSVWGVGGINSSGMIALAGPLPRSG